MSDMIYGNPMDMERQNIEKVFDSMEDMSYIENYTYKGGFQEAPIRRKHDKKQRTNA
jgi:hypothetical protein